MRGFRIAIVAAALLLAAGSATTASSEGASSPGPGAAIDAQITALQGQIASLHSANVGLQNDIATLRGRIGHADRSFIIEYPIDEPFASTGCSGGDLQEPLSFMTAQACPLRDDNPLTCANVTRGRVLGSNRLEYLGLRVVSRSHVRGVFCRVYF